MVGPLDTIRTAPNEPADIVDIVTPGTHLIVPLANGEPTAVLDALEDAAAAGAPNIDAIRVHQMHAFHDRRYLAGTFGDRLKHISYFLSHVTRPHFAAGTIGLVPAHFSEVYQLMKMRAADPLVIAAATPPDRHGYFSLGVSADYTASFIGRARFFLEVTDAMPRTFGRNQVHVSQVVGWCRSDRPLIDVPPKAPREADRRIAGFVAERIPNGATIQTGIGAIPNAIMAALADHRDLGIHTELLSDGVVELIEAGVVNGVRKRLNRTKTVGTFALGTDRLHEFLHENTAVELHTRAVRERPADHRQRAELRVGQRHTDRRFHRPVRVRDDRRDVLLVVGWPERLRPRCDVLRGRPGLRRAAFDHVERRVTDRSAVGRRRRRDHAEEHRRQGGHRMGRRRVAWPVDQGTDAEPDRDRPSRPS